MHALRSTDHEKQPVRDQNTLNEPIRCHELDKHNWYINDKI